jgi:hypothetical protein
MRDLCDKVIADATGEPELLVEGDGPHLLAWREWSAPTVVTKPGSFAQEGVLDQIDALRSPEADLGEAHIVLEPTRALVAVDVNTGGDTSPGRGAQGQPRRRPRAPAPAPPPGLGGQVVVDFVSMSKGPPADNWSSPSATPSATIPSRRPSSAGPPWALRAVPQARARPTAHLLGDD